MGASFCGQRSNHSDEKRLEIKYGEDIKEGQIHHPREMRFVDQDLETKLKDICSNLHDSKRMYKDPTMSTDPIILKTERNQIKCVFQRPYQFIQSCRRGDEPLVIDNHFQQTQLVEVNDQIMQYFGVFLCYLADKPKLINMLIKTNPNTFGFHLVSAFVNGHEQDIIIDDLFLCHNEVPIFSQPCRGKYLWPLILEKTWLKVRGGLDHRVEQGSPEQVFDTFLRFPTQKIILDDGPREMMEVKIKRYMTKLEKQKGYILTSKKDPEHKLGLSGRKNFYLIGTLQYANKQLFYIRNPISEKFTFRGYYSNLDDFEEVKELILKKFQRIDPGNFVVDIEEFSEQFSQLLIVHMVWGNKISSKPINSQNKTECFVEVDTVSKGGDLTLAVEQFKQDPLVEENYFPLSYQVIELSTNKIRGGIENVDGCFGTQNTSLFENNILFNASGRYLIRIKKKDSTNLITPSKTFIVGSYKNDLKFETGHHNELKGQWIGFLQQEGERNLIDKIGKGRKKQDCVHTICWLGDIVFIYVKKTNPKKKVVKIQVNFPELENLECISHTEIRKPNEYNVLKVEDRLVIIFEKINLTAETHINKYHLQAF